MDREEEGQRSPSLGNGGNEGVEDRGAQEGLASLQWQRAEGRMTRREAARCTSFSQRVNAMPSGTPGSGRRGRDVSDDEESGETPSRGVRVEAEPQREELLSSAVADAKNQQMGAPPGCSVPLGGPTTTTFSTPHRPHLSPAGAGQPSRPPPELYPTLSPLHQSRVAVPVFEYPAGTGMLDATDDAFLDDDFQECWWFDEQEGVPVILRGWATRQGERALVYVAGGGVWSGTHEEYRELHRRVAQEARIKRESGSLATPRRYELSRRGAGEYLRRFRRETGGLPSRSTWSNVWRGEEDVGGRRITADIACSVCRRERPVSLAGADASLTAFYENGFRCDMLGGVACGERSSLPRGDVHTFVSVARNENAPVQAAVPSVGSPVRPPAETPRNPLETHEEPSRERNESDDVEIVGFSAAAKQFYKARGPQLHTPTYRGEPSEVDLLAWKRGIEKYFETYGVSRSREKVSLAADLLEGEAARWWNGLWMSGRDSTITTWDELIDKLRERFLPPEGEMRVVGQWRKLQQMGSVAAYADYVFRLKALCDMGQSAKFKLAFFGLQLELQAEVRKYLRQNRLRQLELERLVCGCTRCRSGFDRARRQEETSRECRRRTYLGNQEGREEGYGW